MLITTDQILNDVRSDLFDRPDIDDGGIARDTLWSDEDLLRYLNSAAARLASDTLSLRKRFEFPILANEPQVRFPYDEVLDVITAGFVSPGVGIRVRYLDSFDIDEGVWVDDYGLRLIASPDFTRTGTPTHYTRDYDQAYLRLYPIPAIAGTLVIHAYVLPKQLYPGMPLPFSSFQDRDLLLMWMKKLAYEKQDADTLDLSRAQTFEAEYKRTVVNRASEVDRVRRDGGILQPRF